MATRTHTPLSIAIVGAGMGGLTAASTLRFFGFDVRLYEQATRFARIGGRAWARLLSSRTRT